MKTNSIIDWFKESNRWKHFVGGFVLGLVLTIISPVTAAGCLEFKDRQWGGKFDWLDFWCTVAGGILGQGVQVLVVWLVFF